MHLYLGSLKEVLCERRSSTLSPNWQVLECHTGSSQEGDWSSLYPDGGIPFLPSLFLGVSAHQERGKQWPKEEETWSLNKDRDQWGTTRNSY
jgi:hypothetical protein